MRDDMRRRERRRRLIRKHVSVLDFEDVDLSEIISAAGRIIEAAVAVGENELDDFARFPHSANLEQRFARAPSRPDLRHRRGNKSAAVVVKQVRRVPTAQIINRLADVRRRRLRWNRLRERAGEIN